jgi:hypothetical protein
MVQTAALSGNGIERLVQWAGATLQASASRHQRTARHRTERRVRRIFLSTARRPARYGLVPGRRIVEVDGQPTPDLDSVPAAGERAGRIARRCESRRLGMEWGPGSDHLEARPPLLAGL